MYPHECGRHPASLLLSALNICACKTLESMTIHKDLTAGGHLHSVGMNACLSNTQHMLAWHSYCPDQLHAQKHPCNFCSLAFTSEKKS